MGGEGLFPANPDLANILGDMDLDFEMFHVFFFIYNPKFLLTTPPPNRVRTAQANSHQGTGNRVRTAARAHQRPGNRPAPARDISVRVIGSAPARAIGCTWSPALLKLCKIFSRTPKNQYFLRKTKVFQPQGSEKLIFPKENQSFPVSGLRKTNIS